MSALAGGDNGRDGMRTRAMADIQHRVTDVENEIKVLKNEIKAVLLDIREQYLNSENPFTLAGQVSGGGLTAENPFASAVQSGGGSGPTISIGQTVGNEQAAGSKEARASEYLVSEEGSRSDEEAVADEVSTQELKGGNKRGSPEATGASSSPGLEPATEEKAYQKAGKHGRKGSKGTTSSPSLEPEWEEEEEESVPTGAERGRKGTAGHLPGLGPLEQEADRRKGKQATGYLGGRVKGNGDGINLLTIAGLSKWVDESTEKIGKERTEVMVEACHMVGHLSLELKDLLVKLVRLAQTDDPKRGKITTRDYLGVIAQLDNLLGYGSESEAALLSILADSREPSYG